MPFFSKNHRQKILFLSFFFVIVGAATASAETTGVFDTWPSGLKVLELNQRFTTDSEIYSVNGLKRIYRLAISGEAELKGTGSLIRVIIVDEVGKEYLVYENYFLISEAIPSLLQNTCEETCFLEGISPVSLRIEIANAELQIANIAYSQGFIPQADSLRVTAIAAQSASKINSLNKTIKRTGMTWIAGETSVSKLSYSEKKRLIGLEKLPNLEGFDYYIGGIFQPLSKINFTPPESPSLITDNFDWRNRHGENWMTFPKNQSACGSCAVFATTGVMEALVNLYYNQQIDLDLSEQDIISCGIRQPKLCTAGSSFRQSVNALKSLGAVNESCLPYQVESDPAICSKKCVNPSEKFGFESDIQEINDIYSKDEVKKLLIENGPFWTAVPWRDENGELIGGHAIVITGFKQDRLTSNGPLQDVWIFKNSWGVYWGDNGYGMRADLEWGSGETHLSRYSYFKPTTLKNYSISCTDKDKDGYCFWGLSEKKPSTCPSFCKAEKDCDDNDPTATFFGIDYSCPADDPLKISAFPSSGNDSLKNVHFEVILGAEFLNKTIQYTFYCNRNDEGTNITPGYAKQISVKNTTGSYTTGNICNYDHPGEYTGKVVASIPGTSILKEGRVTITVKKTFSIELTISPESGFSPFSPKFSITPKGSVTGPIKYNLYCFSETENPLEYSSNSNSPFIIKNSCIYSYPGSYKASVSAYRESFSDTKEVSITVLPTALTCLSMDYPADKWQRVWYKHSTGACISNGPNEPKLNFQNTWAQESIVLLEKDDVRLVSSRTLKIDEAGTYRFKIGSDDGMRFLIDGKLVRDEWHLRAFATNTFDVYLTAGNHQLELDYYEDGGWAELSFEFDSDPITNYDYQLTLEADPRYGIFPLNDVDLKATIRNANFTSDKLPTFTFYCDRKDSGTNITPGYVKQLDQKDSVIIKDACDYSLSGGYMAKVITDWNGIKKEERVSILALPESDYQASLKALPNTGYKPLQGVDLEVNLTKEISGKSIELTLYCDRNDNGKDITPDFVKKVTISSDSLPYLAKDICNYEKTGNYTPKVILKLSDILIVESRTTVTVKSPICADLNYPNDKWQRIWFNYSTGECLGSGPDETDLNFKNEWLYENLAFEKNNYIKFSSSRAISTPSTQKYRFSVSSDDGIRLWVDGVLKIDQWVVRGYTNDSFELDLSAGIHKIRLDYFENEGWAGLSFDLEPIPVFDFQATISATPEEGIAPLNGVDLIANIKNETMNPSQNATFTFYCDRNDTNTNIIPGYIRQVTQPKGPITASDICNYSNPGSYTAKVIIDWGGLKKEARKVISVSQKQTYGVTLEAVPSTGIAPLKNVGLNIQVSGIASGEFTYRLDCTNDGVWDLNGSTSITLVAIPGICNFQNPGSYTAKARVEKGTLSAEATTRINVLSGNLPSATTCSTLAYPTDKWQRVWYDYPSGACLGNGPDEATLRFNNNWGTGIIAYDKTDNIKFSSSRTINIPQTGKYKLILFGSDRILLWIDDTLQMEMLTHETYYAPSITVNLTQGNHRFRIDFTEELGGVAQAGFDFSLLSTGSSTDPSSPFAEIYNKIQVLLASIINVIIDKVNQ